MKDPWSLAGERPGHRGTLTETFESDPIGVNTEIGFDGLENRVHKSQVVRRRPNPAVR
jgi:hypothetical protein